MAKVEKALVNCLDYNGRKNILFMMDKSDSRYNNGNYVHFMDGKYSAKEKTFSCDNGLVYEVYSDWSVSKGPIQKNEDAIIFTSPDESLKNEPYTGVKP